MAVQVKTTQAAKRWTGKKSEGKKMTQLQWYLGRKAAKANLKGLFVVFVDFDRWSISPITECYVVPSTFVYDYCNRWVDTAGMIRLHIPPEKMEQFRGAWHLIKDALKAESNVEPEPMARSDAARPTPPRSST